ncbi:metal ABC transporter substrate-binding protein [Streptomyces sp. ACA25]|uniref:metal ABC transporter substrate-binding protein n=1 Tax=Streptomyces sp. ACA25 TaxID=3022596 RepID=UPI003FA6C0E3
MTAPRATRSSRSPRIVPGSLAAGATTLSLLALSACGTADSTAEESPEGGRLDVMASFYPMEFLAERIGGEHVSVTTLTGPGIDPHDLELSPRQTAQLTEADAVVYLEGLQPAIDAAIAQSGVEHIAEATSYTSVDPHDGGHGHDDAHDDDDHGHDDAHEDDGHGHDDAHDDGHGHDDAHDDDHGHDDAHDDDHGHDDAHDDDHGHDDAHEDEDGHGHEDDHDHGPGDPHVWLDPLKYAEVAEGVGGVLAEADPDNAADYEKNTADLVAELHTLHEEFASGLTNTETDTFITTHAAFGHLAGRYGIREEAIAGIDPESEPSAARMRELHAVAKDEGVTTVFFETLASDATARTLAEDLNLQTDVLDPLEGLTDESRGEDYFEVMRANLEALQKALGAAS